MNKLIGILGAVIVVVAIFIINFFVMPTETQSVKLYYYNPGLDRDKSGNILCSRQGLEVVDRKIPTTQNPIVDTIRLLLNGGITGEERSRGVITEYPLAGLALENTNLKNGTLTLTFDDPNNKTSGGACRAGILWFQIEATAKQFPEVKEVLFVPEELFQP
ncbi:MAG: GerMN domain-containing protein [bacterium]|nr:GerMN domain-containing protein [bacterium]